MTDATLQRLLDREAVHEVLYTYCRGADRCDPDIIRSAYHADSYDDHGYWKGNGHDFADFLADRLQRANSRTMHSVTNTIMTLEGDLALCESHVLVTLVRRSPPDVVDLMGARYLDRIERRDGLWKIAERTVVLEWRKTETWSDAPPPIPLSDFRQGERGLGDPLYRFLYRGSLRA
ncbi:nuclear transport factor 2 family protein [Seohaeicola zhoushanensis]|uniref:SnoaL-like domain-containing protein n=1 Tax=Seohaeicola zhoushanensis TaxID=1569283 RepID=A0A8J3H091_9RHOB|nr:nuclear transport factor 2 family protein [Seohaeicola zhoushanensis]GHF66993.1 hypothetical protein GCM10017056_42760 [Seohaeicola zhoushanensis]